MFEKSYLLLSFYCIIQSISSDCPETTLYCFDATEAQVGEIIVNQCWMWNRLSCQPCSSDLRYRKIAYYPYIWQCKHYFPETIQVLDTKTIWADR